MSYSTGDIASITIDSFRQHHSTYGDLLLNITLDDGTTYRGRVKLDADDYKYEIMEDLNYELGHKKKAMMEDMRDLLLNANYSHEDLKEFSSHVNGDDYSLPF